jgi:hypothetical protein
MEAKDAANVILRGVARNQKIIIFPFYARLFWYLYRFHPILAGPLVGGLIKNFRALHLSEVSLTILSVTYCIGILDFLWPQPRFFKLG